MSDRTTILGSLSVGDIFHAESPNGASLICLVMSVTEDSIHARTVTTQRHLDFDRQTGIAKWGDDQVSCTIDSVSPLPIEIHNIMLGIDRKFRLEREEDKLKLNDAEKHALVFIDSYYTLNRL
jgi:hypothetical protein